MKKNLLNFLVASVVAVMAFASVVSAEDKVENEATCTTREVVVLVKSTRGVIYEEKDEGKLISKYTIKDCGDRITIDKGSQSPIGVVTGGQIKCPPRVQDCIKP
jgi:hypothetical protein